MSLYKQIKALKLKKADLTKVTDFKLSDDALLFLNENGWITFYKNGFLQIESHKHNSEMRITDLLTTRFAIDLIEEIIDEQIEELELTSDSNEMRSKLSDHAILSHYGYEITCELPLELINQSNEIITGYCAKWLLDICRKEYK